MQKSLAALIIVLAARSALAKEVSPPLSLRYTCFNKAFLSVSVYVPHRRSFPDVQLRLTDLLGRTFASGRQRKGTAKIYSGRVIEIPGQGHEESSKAVAVEVCGAMQGDYAVVVSEHTNAEYGIAVRADDGRLGNDATSTRISTRQDQTRKYGFRVLMDGHFVSVRWLISSKHLQTDGPTCEPVASY